MNRRKQVIGYATYTVGSYAVRRAVRKRLRGLTGRQQPAARRLLVPLAGLAAAGAALGAVAVATRAAQRGLMVRHAAVFRFLPGCDPAQVAELHDALSALPDVLPAISDFACGPDLGLRAGNGDYGVLAVFEDEAGWRAYQEHPEHRRILTELLEPMLLERVAVQF